MSVTNDPKVVFMTRGEAAELLRMPSSYLANLKRKRRGPRCQKFGTADRCPVRYRLADVLEWVSDPAGHEREVWGKKAATSKRKTRRT
jgi:hypothetical protein